MTADFKQFLLEFAALLEKHNLDIAAHEETNEHQLNYDKTRYY